MGDVFVQHDVKLGVVVADHRHGELGLVNTALQVETRVLVIVERSFRILVVVAGDVTDRVAHLDTVEEGKGMDLEDVVRVRRLLMIWRHRRPADVLGKLMIATVFRPDPPHTGHGYGATPALGVIRLRQCGLLLFAVHNLGNRDEANLRRPARDVNITVLGSRLRLVMRVVDEQRSVEGHTIAVRFDEGVRELERRRGVSRGGTDHDRTQSGQKCDKCRTAHSSNLDHNTPLSRADAKCAFVESFLPLQP